MGEGAQRVPSGACLPDHFEEPRTLATSLHTIDMASVSRNCEVKPMLHMF